MLKDDTFQLVSKFYEIQVNKTDYKFRKKSDILPKKKIELLFDFIAETLLFGDLLRPKPLCNHDKFCL